MDYQTVRTQYLETVERTQKAKSALESVKNEDDMEYNSRLMAYRTAQKEQETAHKKMEAAAAEDTPTDAEESPMTVVFQFGSTDL